MKNNTQQELLDLYNKLLKEQVHFIKQIYHQMFSNLDSQALNELYMTYYAKTKMQPAFVYFIYNKYTKLIKIGKSNNPFKRLNELNSMFKNHFGIENALEMIRIIFVPSGKDYTVEKMFHEKYADMRTFGEWFDVSKDEICEQLPEFLNYDTDNFLENEGFDSNIIFKDVSDYIYAIFALDTLDEYTLKISEQDENKALYLKKLIADEISKNYNFEPHKFLGLFDTRIWNSPFSSIGENKTWEMFRWLYLNKDKFALSTHYKINDSGDVVKKVLSFNKDVEVLDYYQLIKKIANDVCFIDIKQDNI